MLPDSIAGELIKQALAEEQGYYNEQVPVFTDAAYWDGIEKIAFVRVGAIEDARDFVASASPMEMQKFADAADFGVQRAREDFVAMVETGEIYDKIAEMEQEELVKEAHFEEVVEDPAVVAIISDVATEVSEKLASTVQPHELANPQVQEGIIKHAAEIAEEAVLNGDVDLMAAYSQMVMDSQY